MSLNRIPEYITKKMEIKTVRIPVATEPLKAFPLK
jgi:hypothetical protein